MATPTIRSPDSINSDALSKVSSVSDLESNTHGKTETTIDNRVIGGKMIRVKNAEGTKSTPTVTYLSYPANLGSEDPMSAYARFTLFKYTRRETPSRMQENGLAYSAYSPDISKNVTADIISVIYLPIPVGVTQVVGSTFGTVDSIANRLANYTMEELQVMGENAIGGRENYDKLLAEMGNKPVTAGLIAAGTDFLTGGSVASAARAGITNLVTQAGVQYGLSLNPMAEAVYQSPQPRDHSFSYNMIPRNRSESEMIAEIIKTFQDNASPSGNPSTQGLLLEYPALIQVDYVGGDGQLIPGMMYVPDSFITSFTVSYNNNSMTAKFTDDFRPVQYQININLAETKVMLREDLHILRQTQKRQNTSARAAVKGKDGLIDTIISQFSSSGPT